MQPNISSENTFDIKRAYFVLFVLLVPTCFFLNNVKIWDDQYILDANAHWTVKSLLGSYGINSTTYWRPIAVLSIAIPYLIGLPYWACKLISVLMYFLQGCLALRITDYLLKQRNSTGTQIPLISLAILLALHPVFVETTLWVSARADLLLGIFVLIGVYWILGLRNREQQSLPPISRWLALLGGFFLTWITCASKDSGLIWPALATLFFIYFSLRSRAAWKATWQFCSYGTIIGTLSYIAVRIHMLGSMTQLQEVGQRENASIIGRIGLFCEFMVRSILNIFFPIGDPAPFKSAGWYDGVSPAILTLTLFSTFALIGFSVRWIFRRNKISGWLTLCATAAIVFYALIESILEPSLGNIVAARYLAPSATLIYIALATILLRQNPDSSILLSRKFITKVSVPIAILFFVGFLQAIFLWTDLRAEWSSDLALWENSWKLGSHGELAAANYSGELRVANRPTEARKIAQDWLNQHPEEGDNIRICRFYEGALISNIMLGDEANANRIAREAVHIGWCSTDLAQNIAFVLMKEHCDIVRPMLELTLEQGSQSEKVAIWQYKDLTVKKKILLLGAYAEANCGKEEYMKNIFKALEKIDERWNINGPLAQNFIESARKNAGKPKVDE